MKAEKARKVAGEIVSAAEKRYGNARYGDIDTIVASAEEWTTLIAARLQGLTSEIPDARD